MAISLPLYHIMHKETVFQILPLPKDPSQQANSSMTEQGITQATPKMQKNQCPQFMCEHTMEKQISLYATPC